MNAHFRRASLLVGQDRHAEALRELDQALVQDPENPYCHGLRAITLSNLDRYQQALEAAHRTIEVAPDIDYGHFVLARVQFDRERYDEAYDAIQAAIQIDPDDAANFGVLAGIEFCRDRCEQAIEAAERGLQIDPTNELCLHHRAQALAQLGRHEEAQRDLDVLLKEDPNDTATHDARGWLLLRQGKPELAREHFLESLRADANNQSARIGLANALKARHFLFGWILQLLLFCSRFKSWTIYLVIGGVLVALRFGEKWQQAYPDHYVWVVLAQGLIWTAVVALTLAQPLFDLVLRLDREGALALTPDQVRASNWNALCMGAALLAMALWAWGSGRLLPLMALAFLSLTSLVRCTFAATEGWARRRMAWITIGAAVLIPLAYLMPIVYLVLALKAKVVVPILLRGAFYTLAASMLVSCFADEIHQSLEKRRPDKLT